MDIFTQLTLYSAAATKGTDLVRNLLGQLLPSVRIPKWFWNLTAFGTAAAISFLANLHIVPVGSGSSANLASTVALTGGSGIFHELLDFASSAAKKLHPVP